MLFFDTVEHTLIRSICATYLAKLCPGFRPIDIIVSNSGVNSVNPEQEWNWCIIVVVEHPSGAHWMDEESQTRCFKNPLILIIRPNDYMG